MNPPRTTVEQLLERYDGFLLDAYGVLVDGSGPLPGAASFLQTLIDGGRSFVVLSNDASRLPETAASRYRGFGLPIDPDHMVTSGSLLPAHFEQAGLQGRRCIVLGPEDSLRMVRSAGGEPTEASDDAASVIVVCDDAGYPFLPAIEATISSALRRLDRGEPVHLVLPNPDLTYPKAPGEVGLTSGSVAMVIEAALRVRFGDDAPRFTALGKPHGPIFAAGCERLGTDPVRVVMLGDQLGTDIAGASAFGLDSVLVGTGLGMMRPGDAVPTYTLPSLSS
jgi:HAD superfamily hydrolase (TIGR01450 family)